MITEITKAQLLNWRLGVLMNEGKATPQQVSMAKRNACEIATNIAVMQDRCWAEWVSPVSIL